MYRVGVAGPEPSVERIMSVAKDFDPNLVFRPFVYTDTGEVVRIVKEHDHEVDAWLFSGQNPYHLAKQVLKPDKEALFISHLVDGLFRCMIQMAQDQVDQVTMDCVDEDEVKKAIQELEDYNKSPVKYYKECKGNVSREELFRFHYDHYRNGQTNGAVTCYYSVFRDLKEKGVRVYLLTPTKAVIRQSLQILKGKADMQLNQTDVVAIRIGNFDTELQDDENPYKTQLLQLEVKQHLIRLCEVLKGTWVERGNGYFEIFASHGDLEKSREFLENTIRRIRELVNAPVFYEIGTGENVSKAEFSAQEKMRQNKTADLSAETKNRDRKEETGRIGPTQANGEALNGSGPKKRTDQMKEAESEAADVSVQEATGPSVILGQQKRSFLSDFIGKWKKRV
jgi:hypothetical protein